MGRKLGKFVAVGIYSLSGVACGLMFGKVYDDTGNFVISFLTLMIGMYLGFILSVGIHEAGHLVFGLLSGYKFISYRLGNLMIIKKDGKLCLRRFSLAGTAGQCLMSPPEMKDGKIPCVNFNLGGAVFNLAAGAVFLAVSVCLGMNPLYGMIAAINFGTGLSNGIPLHVGLIDNDGMNALSLGRSQTAMKAFATQLRVAAAQTEGKRLRELPDEWFELPSPDEMKENALVATVGVLAANRKLDALDPEGSKEILGRLLSSPAVLGLHRMLLRLDLASIEYLTGNKSGGDRIMESKDVKNLIKAMKGNISILRAEYIAAKADGRPTGEIMKRFERAAASYPYAGDVRSEREIIALAEERIVGDPRV